MKYRIKTWYMNDEPISYIPQFRWNWIPFWASWGTSYTGHDFSTLVYYNKEDALKFIDNERRMSERNYKSTYEEV